MITKKYVAEGLVFGNLWGGGKGSYRSTKLTDTTLEGLLEQATKGLDGSLDSGMGYESLIGALLDITTVTTAIIDGKEFINKESEIRFIGDLSDKQQDFLIECYCL